MREIKFKGKDYILTDEPEGAIVTKEKYQKGKRSYAHLDVDGKIFRLGEQIGTIEDIEFGEEIEIEINPTVFLSGIIDNFLTTIKEMIK